jgi:8-oxo-dGTP pyrophosphatase MutT (NUDIX family)
MFVTNETVKYLEEKYGLPKRLRLNYPTPKKNFDFIRSTQKNDRSHDVTIYLYHHNCLAVTRKPMYPRGAYRPPSGGLNPGESFEAGTLREGFEELGVEVELDKYLLRVRVDFMCGIESIKWTSHVFQTKLKRPEDPVLDPKDKHEIVEAVWADECDFFGSMRQGLLSLESTGLLYRVHLHDIMWRLYGWGKV